MQVWETSIKINVMINRDKNKVKVSNICLDFNKKWAIKL